MDTRSRPFHDRIRWSDSDRAEFDGTRSADVLVPFVRLARLRYRADGHLRGQSELFAQLTVDKRLEPDLVRGPVLERDLGGPGGGGVAGLHRRQQGVRLLGRGRELQHFRHQHIIDVIVQCRQVRGDTRRCTLIPPRRERRGRDDVFLVTDLSSSRSSRCYARRMLRARRR